MSGDPWLSYIYEWDTQKADRHSGFISWGGGLVTSHLNIDPAVETRLFCFFSLGCPDVTVFRPFLLDW